MDKNIEKKVDRIVSCYQIAQSMESLCENRDNIIEIKITAGNKEYKIPNRYFNFFKHTIMEVDETARNFLMNELKAQEEYDG